MTVSSIIFYIGATDAVIIAGLGILAAILIISGQDAKKFWERVLPAAGILVGTSFAAGVVMVVTNWLSG